MWTENQPLLEHKIRREESGYGRLIKTLHKFDQPVISKVHGYTLAEGFELFLACVISGLFQQCQSEHA